MSRKIAVLDTTLRDGEQTPGASMNTQEKLIVAQQLLRMGVDVIEAGFPASSPSDFKSVQDVARLAGDRAVVCALARAVDEDIDRAAEALAQAKRPRIQTGIGVSGVHLKEKLGLSEDEAIACAVAAVKRARSHVDDVQFFCEDSGRADQAFLERVVQAVVDAGATVVNIADTTGYCLPDDYGARIAGIMEHVSGIEKVTVAAHTHNDLGMATACAIAGIRAGATQVECCVNGIGERAGNASLEEVVMALALHGDAVDAHTDVATSELTRTSRLVERITGLTVQANKAVVGANAFAHSSGIHQDGVLKCRATYEILDPAAVGAAGSEIILTGRSGHAALKHRLAELGYTFPDDEFEDVYRRFLEIADQKKEVFDEDLESMVQERQREIQAIYTLEALQVSCGDPLVPTATATVIDEAGERHVVCSTGTGPVDAAYRAIDQVVSVHGELQEFAVKAITRRTDAIGEVSVRITGADGRLFSGRGSDNDIIVSSAKAYIDAINRMIITDRTRQGF